MDSQEDGGRNNHEDSRIARHQGKLVETEIRIVSRTFGPTHRTKRAHALPPYSARAGGLAVGVDRLFQSGNCATSRDFCEDHRGSSCQPDEKIARRKYRSTRARGYRTRA